MAPRVGQDEWLESCLTDALVVTSTAVTYLRGKHWQPKLFLEQSLQTAYLLSLFFFGWKLSKAAFGV